MYTYTSCYSYIAQAAYRVTLLLARKRIHIHKGTDTNTTLLNKTKVCMKLLYYAKKVDITKQKFS